LKKKNMVFEPERTLNLGLGSIQAVGEQVSRLPGGDPSGLGLYCGGSWLILPVSGFKVFLHPMVGVFHCIIFLQSVVAVFIGCFVEHRCAGRAAISHN